MDDKQQKEEEEIEAPEGAAPKKSKRFALVKVAILAVLLTLLGGGGYLGYVKFFKPPPADASRTEVPVTIPLEMGTFLVNLSDPGGKRYLKVAMQLELGDQATSDELTKRNAEVRDIILTLLSSKEFSEISNPVGKTLLKRELLSRLNKTLKGGQVKEIYFSEFLVQ